MKIQKLKQSRFAKLKIFIALLLLAGVGSYLVFVSQAQRGGDPNGPIYAPGYVDLDQDPRDSGTAAHDLYRGYYSGYTLPPAGTTIRGLIKLFRIQPVGNARYDSKSQIVLMVSYDTQKYKFLGSTCLWKHGCTAKFDYNLQTAASASASRSPGEADMCDLDECWHKKKIAFCFTLPPGPPEIYEEVVANYQFQRTASSSTHNGPAIARAFGYSSNGGCESNPEFKDIWFYRTDDEQCGLLTDAENNVTNWDCDNGNGPGAGPGIFTGFGNGSGGEGTGDNGVGTGPGAGSGGGGGGSSANKQADKPNSLPSPSPQGDDKQTELDPDPFFDGKNFEKGSDTDNLVFGNSTIGGKKVPKVLLYILSAVLLGGTGGALWWRWKRR